MRDLGKNETTTAAHPGRSRRRAALVTAAVGAVLAASIPAGIAAAAPAAAKPPVHGLGAIPARTPVAAASGVRRLAAAARYAGGQLYAASALPPSVDLTGFAMTPGNQGGYGACGSFTTAYTIGGWLSNYSHHVGAPFDPMYVYNQLNGGSPNNGTTFSGNFSILENQGDVEAAYWSHPFSDYLSKPNAAELANAGLHKLTAHTTLFQGQNQGLAAQTAIETALANNQPVAIGLPVYPGFDALNTADSVLTLAESGGTSRGNHAVAVLGYNPTGIVIENSWGTGWANHGFATLAWDFVESKVYEAYAAGTFVTGANTLAPAVTALSRATVATPGGTALTVTAARLASVNTTQSGSVRLVSVADPSVQVTATVSANTATTLTLSTPTLPADGNYRVVVTGTGGASVPNGTIDVVTALKPAAVALGAGQVGRSDAATKVTLVGSGFGTTSTAYTANKLTATVAGMPAGLTWVNDEHLTVLVPAAAAGTSAQIIVSRNGVPSPAVTVNYLPPVPVVYTLSPAHVDIAGGTAVTATVKAATTVTGVTLVSTSDSSVQLTTPVTAITTTGIRFTAPAAPNGAEGTFHVVVTGTGGTSLPVAADTLTYRTPLTGTTSATTASAGGGTAVPVTGSGFGATATAFSANKLTATVGGKVAPVTWISDTSLRVSVPSGVPGTAASIVLLHDGVPGAAVTGATYAAVITANAAQSGPLSGWTTSLTGVGFTGSGSWALIDGAGRTTANLPVVTTATALAAASGGAVLISGPTAVSVHLPAASEGMYRLTFTPNASAFPGAQFAFTSRAVVIYAGLG